MLYGMLSGWLFAQLAFGLSIHLPHDSNATRSKTLRGNSTFLKSSNVTSAVSAVAKTKMPVTFQDFYALHGQGRGIWKWNNALDAYQRHFGSLTGTGNPLAIGEVGVQSGGSLLMWPAVLGNQIQLYGFDINPACKSFETPTVQITIGDQSDPVMWQAFFQTQAHELDILVDDGGHEPHQMLTTTYEPFPHIKPGGFLVIEDIHGQNYMQSFFSPLGFFLEQQAVAGLLDSVHVYPFLLMIHKSGVGVPPPLPTQATGPQVPVEDLAQMWEAISRSPGSVVVLRQPSWGSFLTASGMNNFFQTFINLHAYTTVDSPPGCATTTAAICRNAIINDWLQDRVTGIHIYADRLEVDVPAAPPLIQAVRKGTEWIGYGF